MKSGRGFFMCDSRASASRRSARVCKWKNEFIQESHVRLIEARDLGADAIRLLPQERLRVGAGIYRVPGEDLVDRAELVLALDQRPELGMQILRATHLGFRAEGPVHVTKQDYLKTLGENLGLDLGSLVHSCVSEGVAGRRA